MAYRQSLEYGESISRFKRLLALLPADSAISSDYRRTLVQAGLYRDIQWCDSLIRVSGMRFDIILHRADLLLKMGKGKAAMADYALVLDSAGYDRDASFNRFRAAVLTSLPDEAEKEIERTKMNIPRDDPFIAQLSAILADTRSGLQKINESPAAPEGYVLMAKSLVFLKMETESIPYLEKALSLDKQNAQLMLRLAYVYILSGRGDEAKILVRQVSDRGLRIPDELQKMLR
jgi:tetratricopeptide (TPR) repeat protein